MTTISSGDLRDRFSEILNDVAFKGERIFVSRNGRPMAALVPVEDAKLLEELEDKIDLAAALKALEDGDEGEDFEKVVKELGI